MTETDLLNKLTQYPFTHYQSNKQSIWHRLPIQRRALVFILLFVGSLGELRVVLTKRSSKLRSFPGHVSLPGGMADTGLESEWQVSRREMHEEIGLDRNNAELQRKYGFEIKHLNIMPAYLSRTISAVRPCVGFLDNNSADLELALNPGESSLIFSCPLHDFLYPVRDPNFVELYGRGKRKREDDKEQLDSKEDSVDTKEKSAGKNSQDESPKETLEAVGHSFHKVKWGGIPWNLRSYTFPQNNVGEADWIRAVEALSSEEESELEHNEWGRKGSRRDSLTNEKIYDVWGLTANILHDLAEVVYTGKVSREIGEEELIYLLWHYGQQMKEKKRSEEEKKLIEWNLGDKFGFGDVVGKEELTRLRKVYKL